MILQAVFTIHLEVAYIYPHLSSCDRRKADILNGNNASSNHIRKYKTVSNRDLVRLETVCCFARHGFACRALYFTVTLAFTTHFK